MIKYDKTVREGSNDPLAQAHLILLEMMRVVDLICRKHNINYWLTGGTLLGAIRHKGYIPWDDDFDIAMTRDDYNRFIEIAPAELPEGLFFQLGKVDGRQCKWIKIRDNYSTLVHQLEKNKTITYHQGIFLDVTPYDEISKDFSKTKMFVNRKYQFSKVPFVKKNRWLFNQLATIPVKLIGKKRLIKHFMKKYNAENPKYLSVGIDIPNYFFTFDHDIVFPLSEIDFLGHKFMAPGDPHRYLSDMFGDYMTLPPKEKQKAHHAHEIFPYKKCNHPSAIEY